jgi:hypothetical protein
VTTVPLKAGCRLDSPGELFKRNWPHPRSIYLGISGVWAQAMVVFFVPRIKLRVLHMPDKHSTIELQSQPQRYGGSYLQS